MARMRSLKPEFWSDLRITRVSRDARLLYLALWNQSDEWARCHGDIRWIKGHCLPYDDDLNLAAIDALLNELAGIGRIVRYVVHGEPFLYLPKLAKHQRLEPNKTPSRLPPPPVPDESEKIPDESEKISERSEQIVVQQGACSREHVAGSREHEAGRRSPKRSQPIPDDFEVTEQMRAWANTNAPGIEVDRVTLKFVSHYRATGATLIDWQEKWRSWLLNERPANGRASPQQSTTDQRVNHALGLAQRYAAEEATQQQRLEIEA